MDCIEAIEYIHSLEKFGILPGLERISELCEILGNPQNDVKFVHVAGTNGKGSTSTMTSNILKSAGYNVGLYISPYVVDFRERIQLNGEMICPEDLAYCVEKVKDAYESVMRPKGLKITEFEAITAAAFLFFKIKKCDYAVLEVGLGGRFDATNIIEDPEVCMLAYIGMDHMAILGDTIEKIASEKCGIIKENCKVVSYPLQRESAMAVISETCSEKKCKLTIPDVGKLSVLNESISGTQAIYDGISFNLRLAGKHIVYNALGAIECCRALGVSDKNIADGIEKTQMPARMELLGEKPWVILDGGHNSDCAQALKDYLTKYVDGRRVVMLSSIMADKEYDSYLGKVAPFADVFIATKADVPRALESDILCSFASKYCENVIEVKKPSEAVNKLFEIVKENDVAVICGSFYLAGEIREKIICNIAKGDK